MIVKPMRGVKPTQPLNRFPYLASPKIDGLRAIVKDGAVYSKSMKPIPQPRVQELFGHLHGADGELVIGEPYSTGPDDDVFDRSRGILMRKTPEPDADIRFYVFDIWDAPHAVAAGRVPTGGAFKGNGVHIVEHTVVRNQQEVDEYLSRCLAQHYEGAMLRQAHAFYKYGQATERQAYLLKLKPFVDGEAEIIGYAEQMENTNVATTDELGYTKRSSAKAGKVGKGTFGAFLVRDLETGAEFSVGNGPGLTQAKRDEFWAKRDELVGQIITYKYQEVGTRDAPRLPQFLRFRDRIDLSEVGE
jgi:DNA ligase 1